MALNYKSNFENQIQIKIMKKLHFNEINLNNYVFKGEKTEYLLLFDVTKLFVQILCESLTHVPKPLKSVPLVSQLVIFLTHLEFSQSIALVFTYLKIIIWQ